MSQQTFIDLNKLMLEIKENKVIQVCYDSKISFLLENSESKESFKHKKFKLSKESNIHLVSLGNDSQHWIYLLKSIKRVSKRYYYSLSSWYLQLIGKAYFVQQREPEFSSNFPHSDSLKEAIRIIHEKTKLQQIANNPNEIRH